MLRVDAYLDTDRLSLRRFTADDADLLIELDSDPLVMRYLSGGEPTPAQVIRERYLPNILAQYERWNGRFGLFAAHAKGSGAFVGFFILRPERDGPLDSVELGYRLRQAQWGRGYATEGSKALLHKAFGELGVRTVWAGTKADNAGSRHVLEKLGMELSGTVDDGVRYALDRSAFQPGR